MVLSAWGVDCEENPPLFDNKENVKKLEAAIAKIPRTMRFGNDEKIRKYVVQYCRNRRKYLLKKVCGLYQLSQLEAL